MLSKLRQRAPTAFGEVEFWDTSAPLLPLDAPWDGSSHAKAVTSLSTMGASLGMSSDCPRPSWQAWSSGGEALGNRSTYGLALCSPVRDLGGDLWFQPDRGLLFFLVV